MANLIFRDVAKNCGVNLDSQDAQRDFYNELMNFPGVVSLDANSYPVVNSEALTKIANTNALNGKLAYYKSDDTDTIVEAADRNKAPTAQPDLQTEVKETSVETDTDVKGDSLEDDLDAILSDAGKEELATKLGKPSEEVEEAKPAKAAKPKKVSKKVESKTVEEETGVENAVGVGNSTSEGKVGSSANSQSAVVEEVEIVLNPELLRKTFTSLAASHRALADVLENLSAGIK